MFPDNSRTTPTLLARLVCRWLCRSPPHPRKWIVFRAIHVSDGIEQTSACISFLTGSILSDRKTAFMF